MVAAFLCLVLLFFLYDLWRGLRRGVTGWGQARRLRLEQPREFWGQFALSCSFALGLAGSLIWHLRNGDWPKFPILQFVTALWMSALIIPTLASGRASVGTVSFTRAEEPREYWILFAGGVLILTLAWVTILLKAGAR